MAKIINKHFFFDIEKVIQVLGYIQKQSSTQSKRDLLKYLFFADRVNVRRHFSLISLDTYYAMPYGPVASNAYNILEKQNSSLNFSENDLALLDFVEIPCTGPKYCRLIKTDKTDLLTKNNMRSIDFVIETFHGADLVRASHEYPEWKQYASLFDQKKISRETINIIDFFTNPDIDDSPYLKSQFGKDPLYEDEDYLNEAKEYYLENERKREWIRHLS